jgi:hypothetical protein
LLWFLFRLTQSKHLAFLEHLPECPDEVGRNLNSSLWREVNFGDFENSQANMFAEV